MRPSMPVKLMFTCKTESLEVLWTVQSFRGHRSAKWTRKHRLQHTIRHQNDNFQRSAKCWFNLFSKQALVSKWTTVHPFQELTGSRVSVPSSRWAHKTLHLLLTLELLTIPYSRSGEHEGHQSLRYRPGNNRKTKLVQGKMCIMYTFRALQCYIP